MKTVTKEKKELSLVDQRFSMMKPKSLDEAMKFADMISKSEMIPDHFKGKAGDVLIAMQLGFEIGVNPITALQNIAVINKRTVIWGDLVVGIVQASGTCEYLKESWDEKTLTATCRGKRRGQPEAVQSFSMADATRAGLADKDTYKKYGRRMCQWRAKTWVIRDLWADYLKGLSIREEVEDYPESPREVVQDPIAKPEALPEPSAPASVAHAEPLPKSDEKKIVQVGILQVTRSPKSGRFTIHGKDSKFYYTDDENVAKMAKQVAEDGTIAEMVLLNSPAGSVVNTITNLGDAGGE